MSSVALEPQVFRRALGVFATGVTIITARAADGRPVGLSCNSFNSVSLDPPLIQWCIGRSSRNYAHICAASHFAVHILNAGQRELCRQFSAKDCDRFASLALETGLGDVPLLERYHARFECSTYALHEAGDHTIVIGRVLRLCEQAGEPLIFYGGAFSSLGLTG
jgi:flavin reductase (DIM6/NTAB) family NADH-FMN oxidoreductase RutF